MEWMALILFLVVCLVILSGYPVAFALAGTSLIFALIGYMSGTFDASFLETVPNRLFGIMSNEVLMAVPLFVFMGVMLERSKIAQELLDTMASCFGSIRGGMGFSVIIVGMLLAASTGIVGATVVTMGLLSLPTMLKRGCDPALSSGIICASGTLGQIIPPSIVLVILGDVISNSYQQAQLKQGVFSPEAISVGDLFLGAIGPGLLLVLFYLAYTAMKAWLQPQSLPAINKEETQIKEQSSFVLHVIKVLLPPLLMIAAVLGSIIAGAATPTEAASVGAVGAILLACCKKRLNLQRLQEVMQETTKVTAMVFVIFMGASVFSVVFRGFGGDEAVHNILNSLPGGKISALIIVMLLMFLLGFILDFIEITFVVVPIVAPILLMMDIDPIWLGIMIALNLQTSFLTPPFGFALFYLRGVAPKTLSSGQIYKGVVPFIIMQLLVILTLAIWPTLATWLPQQVYG